MSSSRYHIRPIDLRTESALDPILELLDPTVPTLLIAECVLAYMDRRSSDALLRWLSDRFDVAAAVVYEMFGLDDSFGRVMRDNLKVCTLVLRFVSVRTQLIF